MQLSGPFGALGLLALAASLVPSSAGAQVEISAGLLVDPSPSVGSTRVGPILSVAASARSLGIPLFLDAGVARTDFNSLGQDYHHNYYLFTLGAEWFPVGGPTRVGLRLGLGAVGEYEVVETDPASPGGSNWSEALVPGLMLDHEILPGKRLTLGVSDHVLGPLLALADPEEYGIEHRWRFTLGLRF